MSARADRFPLVDALRAIAALAVLGTHAAFFGGAYEGHTALGPYAQRLDVGVTVFFLISGFLLYPALQRRWPGGVLRTELLGLLALALVSEAWKAAVLAQGNPAQVHIDPALLALPAYLDHFALGMALALLTVWIERRGRAPRWVGLLDR